MEPSEKYPSEAAMKDREGWLRLEARAHWLLEHPDQIPPLDLLEGRSLRFRLWQYRPFGPRRSWGLFVPMAEGDRALAREVTWDEAVDRRHMSSRLRALKRRPAEEPTVHVRNAVVDRARLEPLLLDAHRLLPVGAIAPDEAAPGGDEFGIEGYREMAYVRLAWQGRLPAEHRDAVAWAVRLRTFLESSLLDRETA